MSTTADSDRFDAIILGAGPAGEVAASRLSERGLGVALVEQELVGGECAYWACIPSKTLLRPGEVQGEAERAAGSSTPELRWREAAEYRDFMIRHLDDKNEIEGYEKSGVRVFKGQGSLRGPGKVEVDGQTLQGERIVVATGSEANIPPIEGLDGVGYWTNREATTLSDPPDSAVVLGGGPVGIELAQLMHRFGTDVHLVESADRLLAREDPRVSELLLEAIRADGIDVRLGSAVSSVSTSGGHRVVHFGGEEIGASELVVAVGRKPRVDGLSLESVGLSPGPRGIEVDEHCRAAEGIWAIGDVTGQMPFTHVAMYQARIACADIAGESVRADYAAIPRVVFSDPEVAAVGMTEAQAYEAGLDVATARLPLGEAIARPWTFEKDPRGELAVIVDRRARVLVGAWAVGPLASEWIHYAALAIKARIPIAVLKDTVAQFPTYTEVYLKALERLEL
jgi:pyruvate/2-oxoglutarate dehydrogenase complex dihydrolipoamide dehydrogenase (E3) component